MEVNGEGRRGDAGKPYNDEKKYVGGVRVCLHGVGAHQFP